MLLPMLPFIILLRLSMLFFGDINAIINVVHPAVAANINDVAFLFVAVSLLRLSILVFLYFDCFC